MLQRLIIALAQVKAGNTPENLLNQIRHIIYSVQRRYQMFVKSYGFVSFARNIGKIYILVKI